MVAIRILGGGSAQILGITIDPDFTIGVLLILTAIHVLLLNYFLVEMSRGWQNLSFEDRKSIFDELSSSALLTRGLYDVEIRASDDWLFFKADMRSPYGTLYLMLYFLFALACLEVTSSIMLPTSLTVGLAIASFNWRIASSWILAFIDFGKSQESLYFGADLKPHARYFSTLSLPHYLPPEPLHSFVRRGVRLAITWGIFIFSLYGIVALLFL